VLLLFAKKATVSTLGLFWLSLMTAAILSVILYAVSKPLQKFAVDKTLRLTGHAPLNHSR
jgi:membrane protein implicated in regulation of membrane protease activity